MCTSTNLIIPGFSVTISSTPHVQPSVDLIKSNKILYKINLEKVISSIYLLIRKPTENHTWIELPTPQEFPVYTVASYFPLKIWAYENPSPLEFPITFLGEWGMDIFWNHTLKIYNGDFSWLNKKRVFTQQANTHSYTAVSCPCSRNGVVILIHYHILPGHGFCKEGNNIYHYMYFTGLDRYILV